MKYKIIILLIFYLLCKSTHSQNASSTATLIYFNDTHEISPVSDRLGQRGGIARLKTVIDSIKNESKDCKVIFGGDLSGGSLFGSIYRGFPIIEAFNKIPVNYANFGQHDFDFGENITRQLIDKSDFDWISTNLVEQNGKTFHSLPDHAIIDASGIKGCLIGLTDAMHTTSPNNIIQKDLITSAKELVNKIKKENVDFILAVTQTSFEINKSLLEAVPEIDLIFTEEVSESISQISYLGNRPIISTRGNTGSVARVEILKRSNSVELDVKIFNVDSTVKEDSVFLQIQNEYQNKLENKLNHYIARVNIELDAGISGDYKCRWKETNIGNLIADSFRDYYRTDIALINGGGIRANIPVGDLTMRDALAVLPFNNTIVKIRLKGRDLHKILEYGVSGVNKREGRFLHLSGAKYAYNPVKNKGERIYKIEVSGKPIDHENEYTVALPEYLFLGGDGFNFPDDLDLISSEKKKKDVQILVDFCKKKEVITYATEGRIVRFEK